jgi:hypothetical protein
VNYKNISLNSKWYPCQQRWIFSFNCIYFVKQHFIFFGSKDNLNIQVCMQSTLKSIVSIFHHLFSHGLVLSWYTTPCLHWWKKGLWSRFIWAIGPGCWTGIHYSGPMPVPVPARTGTDRSPRGRAAGAIPLGQWSRFVARTGIVDLRVFLFFFHSGIRVLFGVYCIQFNGAIYIQQ